MAANGGSVSKRNDGKHRGNSKQLREPCNVDFRKGELGWCAVQVRPQYEVLVAAGLCAKGYREFLPMYRTKRQWSDRRKEIDVPMFTGYVFCKLNRELPGAIVTTPGVIRIVGTRKEIAFIDDWEIEAIRIVVASGKKVEPCAYAGIGDQVLITSGTLAGVEGSVVAYRNQQRLVVSLHLIQSSISVEVDCSMALTSKSPILVA
jgi:transcription antitermination factor NusG